MFALYACRTHKRGQADLSALGQYRPPRVVPRPWPEAQHEHTGVFLAGTPASPRTGSARQPARRFAWWREEKAVTEHYDVIIVGSGAGGGTLAHALASSGKRVLLLERGRSASFSMIPHGAWNG